MGAPEQQRRAIQNSKESIAKLSKYYNLNPKTIVKWRKRSFTKDADKASEIDCLNSGRGSVAFRKCYH